MKSEYTIIVPRADRTGPSNLAVDIGNAAAQSGWRVRLLYLSGEPVRHDLSRLSSVRRFRISDFWRLRGIVHTHGLRPDLVGWLLSWSARRKLVSTIHGHFPQHLGFDYPRWKVNLAWCVWSAVLRRFDVRVAISRTMCRYYFRSLPGVQFDLAYNFCGNSSDEIASPSQDIVRWFHQQRTNGRTVLSYVGSLTERKNIRDLVRHVIECPEMALVVCGHGPLAESLATMLRDRKDDRVLLAGRQSSPESVVQMSDLLVLPSSAEGLPLVVLEAARIGVPSLLSNIAVHREIASVGLGSTFNHKGYQDFREKAVALANDRSQASDGARRAIWQRRFSPEAGFARYEQLFLSLT